MPYYLKCDNVYKDISGNENVNDYAGALYEWAVNKKYGNWEFDDLPEFWARFDRDVKTTITVYNSVDNEYIRQTTEKFNEKVKEDQLILEQKKRDEILEERKEKFVKDMSDDEFDDMLQKLMAECLERKRKKQSDMEM